MPFSNISVQYKENMLANKHAKITTMDSISKVKCQLWLGFLCPHIFTHTPSAPPYPYWQKGFELAFNINRSAVEVKTVVIY